MTATDDECSGCEAEKSLDALLAENQRLEHERNFLQRELGFKNTQRQEIQRLREALRMMKPYAERYASADEIAQVRETLEGDT